MSSPPGSPPGAPRQPPPPLREGFYFPFSMPVLSIYVCQGIQVGVYLLHTRRTFPSLSCYLKTLCTGSSFILLPSLGCQSHFSSSSLSAIPPLPPLECGICFCFPKVQEKCNFLLVLVTCDWFRSVSPGLQLYGEYREQLGNFARREAARLLTERQWRRQAEDNAAASGRRGLSRRHHHHPVALESHLSHTSSTMKPRPYSKCQGKRKWDGVIQICSLISRHSGAKRWCVLFSERRTLCFSFFFFFFYLQNIVLLHSSTETDRLSDSFSFWILCTLWFYMQHDELIKYDTAR